MSQEATIRRGVRNARYAAIPNHVFEDSRLSMEARWLLSYLLSKPDNWTVVIGDIIKKGNCGRDKARKMIAELVDLGYAEREQQRDDGKFGSSVLVIFDEPSVGIHSANSGVSQTVAFLPQTDLPATATPSPVSPSPVKSAHSNNSDLVITENQQREGVREDLENRSATPGTAEFRKRVQCFLSGEGYHEGEWPKWAKSTTIDYITRHFAALPEPDRKHAEASRDAFLVKCRSDGGHVMGAGNYFRDRAWEVLSDRDRKLPDRVPEPDKAFSKEWMGFELSLLLAPEAPLPRLTSYLQSVVMQGGPMAESTRRDHRMRYAWPRVTEMHNGYKPVRVPSEVAKASEVFKSYNATMDAAIVAAWKRLYEHRGWPWPSVRDDGWICFPATADGSDQAVDDALQIFKNAITKGQGDEHAA